MGAYPVMPIATRLVSKKPKFNRIFRLTIGVGANQVVIEDLGDNPQARRISFNIVSVLQSYTQGATFQIYNLSIEEINMITEIKSPIVFQAGYKEVHGENPPVIYNGNVEYPNSARVGTDIVTTLTCQAFRSSLSAGTPVSYEEGTPVTTVLQDLQKDILDAEGSTLPIEIIGGTDLGNLTEDTNSGSMGKQQFLDFLSLNYSFNWWCDTVTKQFIIVPVGMALRENEILLINSKTGLIKSPEISANGLSFETMLEPEIRYLSLLQIEYSLSTSTFLTGTDINNLRDIKSAIIKASKVEHRGDSRGDEWKTSGMGVWYATGVDTKGLLG